MTYFDLLTFTDQCNIMQLKPCLTFVDQRNLGMVNKVILSLVLSVGLIFREVLP